MRNFPFAYEYVKNKGEIAVDEEDVLFLPPILWEKVLNEVRKREEQKIWKRLKEFFFGKKEEKNV
jgi:hypothetical protein